MLPILLSIASLFLAPSEPLCPEHLEGVRTAFLSTAGGERPDREFLASYFGQKITPRLQGGHMVYLAEVEGEVVGYAIFEPLDGEGSYYLAEMAVAADHQRKGIGHQLVFANEDATSVVLITRSDNRAARSFYEAVGFVHSSFSHPDYPKGFVGYEWSRR